MLVRIITAVLLFALAAQAAKNGSGVTINSGNSIASGIIKCFVMYDGSGTTVHNTTGLGPDITFDGTDTPTWQINDPAVTWNPGVQFASGQQQFMRAANDIGALTQFSFMLVEKSVVSNPYAMFFSTGQSSNPEIELRLEGTGTALNFLVHGINHVANVDGADNFADGAIHIVIGTWKNDGAGNALTHTYLDGVTAFANTSTGFTNPDLSATSWLNFGDRTHLATDSSSGGPLPLALTGTEYMFVMWNRELTLAEAKSLQQIPFQFLTGGSGSAAGTPARGFTF